MPAGRDAVANGVQTGHATSSGRTIWTYRMARPMATELTQLAVGDWDFSTPQRHEGVVLRDATAPSVTPACRPPCRSNEPARLHGVQVGPYPFDTTVVRGRRDVGFSLETQTLELCYFAFLHPLRTGVWDPTMLHELAHMWFGDSVAPYEWSDLWNNEGHASWYEFPYAESRASSSATPRASRTRRVRTLDDLMRAVYAHGDEWRNDYGPVALPISGDSAGLFSFQVYHGGALVLYALARRSAPRRSTGGAGVGAALEGESASTDDYIALAAEVVRCRT